MTSEEARLSGADLSGRQKPRPGAESFTLLRSPDSEWNNEKRILDACIFL
jgi:hypothetical protein